MTEILALGAESILFKITRWNQTLALKWRQSKPYLLEEIDFQLRKSRTNRECKMLTVARALGVRTPAVYSVDYTNHTILMDYIEGKQFKHLVEQISDRELVKLCHCFGQSIGLLHKGDVVHGDPTTSNLIIDNHFRLWLVDFGLSEMNATVEMKGVDLHLIHRALETTHWARQEIMLESTIDGYIDVLETESEDPLARMKHIRERGRYH
ncbi:MAG: Kae1-associated serine/threonine protein kinase [Candidatus Thorarchaeota archaeon]|nr:Kae1-associated serine/threonine protein kinase [Candidatus Thorarchaeota archaeon]